MVNSNGSEFHNSGATISKAQSPFVSNLDLGTANKDWSADIIMYFTITLINVLWAVWDAKLEESRMHSSTF